MKDNTVLDEIIQHNSIFVSEDRARPFRAEKKPSKKVAVVACMDTRLITMLTAALGLENGEANIIKVAGAGVDEPYGAVMRSLLIAVYELEVDTIMVVAHTECGAQHMSGEEMSVLMRQAGIDDYAFEAVKKDGIDLDVWLKGFGDTQAAVHKSVAAVRSHPLIPAHVEVRGFVIDTQTGELTSVD